MLGAKMDENRDQRCFSSRSRGVITVCACFALPRGPSSPLLSPQAGRGACARGCSAVSSLCLRAQKRLLNHSVSIPREREEGTIAGGGSIASSPSPRLRREGWG